MKLGVITLTEGFNYGCKLQNYAMIHTLKSLCPNDEVYTIYNDTCCGITGVKKVKHSLKLFLKNRKQFKLDNQKLKIFRDFNSTHLNMTNELFSYKNKFDNFDVFICGSDQIWNPNYVPNIDITTAYFTKKNALKIAYAASFGVSTIPEERKEEYIKCIGNLDYISVRESDGVTLLENMINRHIDLVVDPTLLLDINEWTNFEEKINNVPEKYILTYFLKGQKSEVRSRIWQIAKETNSKIINLNDVNDAYWYTINPKQFVYLIHNCEMFFTDSFHGCVFSIIFKKNFWVFERNSKHDNQRQSGRIYTLLNKIHLEKQIIDMIPENLLEIDYTDVDKILMLEKEVSINYLLMALNRGNHIYIDESKCSGCGACFESCPVNAITWKQDDLGFEYPSVNNDICIHCGKCKRVCMYQNGDESTNLLKQVAFMAKNNSEDIRKKSSSGGIFYALAKFIISEGGIVYSPKYDDNFYLKHEGVSIISDLEQYLGSKYTQSNAHNIFHECELNLKKGRRVLFTGTPCQINGLKNYLGKEYNNLFIQDLICHGCLSRNTLLDYICELQERYKSVITSVEFRNKEYGWKKYSLKFIFENGDSYISIFNKDPMFCQFLRNYSLRKSCYDCISRRLDRRSDITLGDFWGIDDDDDDDDLGTSIVIINSEKGMRLFRDIQKDISCCEEVNLQKVLISNSAYNSRICKPLDYYKFNNERNKDFEYLYKKYLNINVVKKIKRKILSK